MSEKNNGFDILIPYHGQYTLVRQLIGNVILYTKHLPYRITIIDDGSPNIDFFQALCKSDIVDGVRQNEQKGFGAALNLGIQATKRPWVVLLNSDVIINEIDWLNKLYDSLIYLNKSGKVGLVSARSDNPPGSLDLLRSDKEKREDIGDMIVDQALPLFCALTARKMIEKVGAFKEYPYGWYEDEEYFWRMKVKGYHQGISGRAWVQHLGGATIKELWSNKPELKTIMENNRKKCLNDLKTLFKR